jgi:DNA-binding MarR family transcriptional regulator
MIDPEELARLGAEFGKAYARWMWSEMERAGTTPARARLLMALQCQGSCKMSEVGVRLGVTPRNVTKLVDNLEEEGLVIREAYPHDRRATLLRLTDRGVAVCKESMMANHAAVAHLYEHLCASDRQHLARILRKLLMVLEEKELGAERQAKKAR